MSKIKTRLMSLLVALSCVFACLGVFVAVSNVNVASAATTFTINRLDGLGSSDQSHIDAYVPTDEYKDNEGNAIYGSKPSVNSWSYKFTFVEGTGAGFRYNGEIINDYEIKQPGTDFYIKFGERSAVEGDIVTIDGTFKNEDADVEFVFVGCGLQFDGTKWVFYNRRNIGKLTLHVNSSVGGASGLNSALYLQREDGRSFPVLTWAREFVAKNAECFKINDNGVEGMTMKSTGDGMYFGFDSVEADTVITVGGEFYCEALNETYIIEESSFKWDNTKWDSRFELGKIKFSHGSAQQIYFKPVDESKKLPVNSWDHQFSYLSGNGITLDGVEISYVNTVKSPDGTFFVDISKAAQSGNVLKIAGELYCANARMIYVIEESCFQYNGSTWVEYVEPTEYTTHQIGALILHGNSNVGGASGSNNVLYLMREDGGALPVLDWNKFFVAENAENFKVNGETATLSECKSTDGGFYLVFNALSAGDVLTISGTFTCEDLAVKYVIEESHFQWTGERWNVYVPPIVYTEYVLNTVGVGGGTTSSVVYLYNAETGLMPSGDWDSVYSFVVGSGEGLKLNGVDLDTTDIKQPGDFFINLKKTAVAGDVLTIDGAYANETTAKKFIFVDCALEFNGTTWVEYVPQYTVVDLGKVFLTSTTTNSGYIRFKSDVAFASAANKYFTYSEGTGVLQGETKIDASLKQVATTYLQLNLSNDVTEGQIVTIGGSFVYEDGLIKYVIADTKFQWDGSAWSVYEEVYELGKMSLNWPSTNAENAKGGQLYLLQENGQPLPYPDADWNTELVLESGDGLKVNGVVKSIAEIESTNIGLFFSFAEVQKGDKVSISGTFLCEEKSAKYVVERSVFEWNGTIWYPSYEDSDLEDYDVVTIADLGLGTEFNADASSADIDKTALKYVKSANNTTGSVKFRFGYKPTGTFDAQTHIRLRSINSWWGIRFILSSNTITSWYKNSTTYTLPSSAQGYVIELGAIDLKDGENIFVYAKVDGALVICDTIAKTAEASLEDIYTDEQGNEKRYTFGAFNTNGVSVYFNQGVNALITDPDHVLVTYTTSAGTFTEYANTTEDYVLAGAKSYNTFIGWWINGVLYDAEATIPASDLSGSITATAVEIKFTLEDGASIRIPNETGERAGIRFTANIDRVSFNTLINNYGITVEEYGILIMPYDWLGEGQQPNLDDADLTVEGVMLKLVADRNNEPADGDISYKGAMVNINAINYERLFAGRGYMKIKFANDDVKYVYTYFNADKNVRSIRQIAQKYKTNPADQNPYSGLNQSQKDVVDAYAAEVDAEGNINLMNYDAYRANNYFELTAWYYPELDPSDDYNNATNIAIANKMKNAGIKVVYLDGEYHLDLNTLENVEKTRQIIKFFWSQGLKTIAFGSNASDNLYIDYSAKDFPDFSDCEGFMGFLVWDEPQSGDFATLAEFAEKFETTYAGTGATFMANLLPSYASIFNQNAEWWEINKDTWDEEGFKQYLQDYCDIVLSKISGEKWLSLDTYPVNSNQSLTYNFLFDLAMLKYYSLYANATSHAVLQSSGWQEGDNSKNRMPTIEEMRMQAYTAMAFGIDSISWWSYSDKRDDNQQNPTDSDDYYNRFATVNNELASFGHVYRAFNNWKGIILGIGSSYSNEDYDAYDSVQGQIGDYELSATDTKHLSKVSTNQTRLNYLMGVMEDTNGNEGYVLCNYNDHTEDRAQTITITFDSNVTEVIIYRGGVKTPVAVASKTLTVNLATGEGVMIIPSKIG